MIRSGRIAVILLLSLAAMPAFSAESDPDKEEAAVQAWGATHSDCGEWSDACVVCKRDGDATACSTPGIACTPQPTACRKPAPGTKL